MTNQHTSWSLNIDQNQIGWLHFNVKDSKVNTLSQEALHQLQQQLTIIERQNLKGLIILSDKKSGFIVGADIEAFTHISTEHEATQFMQRARRVLEHLEHLPIPTLSLIHGSCLGGGLELALACDYRIAQEDAKLGFPEIMLGIFPGFGGSVRSIQKLGLINAMTMMLSGRAISAKKAKSLKLVDEVVTTRHLHRAAAITIEQAAKTQPRFIIALRDKLMASSLGRKLIAHRLRYTTTQRVNPKHYPAPFALIDMWETYGGNLEQMYAQESKEVAKLLLSPQAKNLIHLFFVQQRLKSFGKAPNTDNREHISHVHIIGAGIMGGDIAAWCAVKGLKVSLQDQHLDIIAAAVQRASALFRKELHAPRAQQAALDRLIPDLKGDGIAHADLVIEAIVENLEVKQGLYQVIEPHMKANAILASNTSGIPMDKLAKPLQHPERFVGIHFFNPVAKMKLVEVVSGTKTAASTLQAASTFVTQIRRLPLPVKSSPGFLINRILMPYLMEAMYMIEEGIKAEAIDLAATNFGMPMGPIELADRVGLDICCAVAQDLSELIKDSLPSFVEHWVQSGRLGAKSGHGFYHYKKGKKVAAKQQPVIKDEAEITERLILRIINEAQRCLQEAIVSDEDLLDAGMVFGTGFAPFRGGVMRYISETGHDVISDKLQQKQLKYGARFQGGM